MNIPHVFAKSTIVASDLGSPVAIQGGSCWFADDPLVLARPDLFSEDCRYAVGRDESWTGSPPPLMAVPPDEDTAARRGPGRPRARVTA